MGQLVRAVAAGRSAKELFKKLRKVTVTANPFDHRSTTAREFLKRVRTPPVKKENPKLETHLVITEEYGSPMVSLQYADGYEQNINTGDRKIIEIMEEVERIARWKGDDVVNPFEKLKERRAKAIGLQ